jgi:UPF0042 nucleotide-binding protein
MKLIIVSGLSGSGKSIALDTLEDSGYYCLDNLPVSLLENFVRHIILVEKACYAKTAIGIDARNQTESLLDFVNCLEFIRQQGITCEVMYLHAEEATLLKRYSETRRKHPLTTSNIPLKEAIKLEEQILRPVTQCADRVIDTSKTHCHQLRELIKNQIGEKNQPHLALQFQSFGFKHGIPLDADFVFDARCLPNPYWSIELRSLTGKDLAVVEFLQAKAEVQAFFNDVAGFIERWSPRFAAENRSYLTVAIGCTGGQHRSVYLVETLAKYFQKQAVLNIIVRHRELY